MGNLECKYCHYQIEKDWIFCPKCGTKTVLGKLIQKRNKYLFPSIFILLTIISVLLFLIQVPDKEEIAATDFGAESGYKPNQGDRFLHASHVKFENKEQDTIPAGYSKYDFPGYCCISIPNTFELRDPFMIYSIFYQDQILYRVDDSSFYSFVELKKGGWSNYEISFLAIYCLSQGKYYSLDQLIEAGWDEHSIRNKLLKGSESYRNLNYLSNGQEFKIVFQQQGLGDFDSEAFNKYARIILTIYPGNAGDYIYNEEQDYLLDDFSGLEKQLKEQYLIGVGSSGFKIINWFTPKFIHINGANGIECSYIREGYQGNIKVYDYLFFNYYEEIDLTISYRQSEEEIWGVYIQDIVNSFKIHRLHKK